MAESTLALIIFPYLFLTLFLHFNLTQFILSYIIYKNRNNKRLFILGLRKSKIASYFWLQIGFNILMLLLYILISYYLISSSQASLNMILFVVGTFIPPLFAGLFFLKMPIEEILEKRSFSMTVPSFYSFIYKSPIYNIFFDPFKIEIASLVSLILLALSFKI